MIKRQLSVNAKTLRFFKALRVSLLLLVLMVLGATAVAPTAAQSIANFEPAECWFDNPLGFLPGQKAYECGYVIVPEQHAHPDGPTIKIPVAIGRTASENPLPDPIFMAQGGPGGDAFGIFPIVVPNTTLAQNRDIVIFNQRGTLYAEPSLLCTEGFDAATEIVGLLPEEAEQRSLEALTACYQRLVAEDVNLSAFNSLENAADIDVIREALGYDEYNYYGVSYGTLLGLHLIENHPENVRSVILDGVVPPNLNFIPQVTANTDRVFNEIIQTCERDSACREMYPNLENRFFALVDSLNETPIELMLKEPETGQRVPALMDGDTLVEVLFQAFYLPDAYASFPKLVANLEAGDYTFIREIWPLFAFDRTMSEGMYFSVICAEDADFSPEDIVLEGVRPYFAEGAEEELQSYLDICEIWQVDQLPNTVDAAVSSEVPTLLLSGFYDPITPPPFAEVAAASLPHVYAFVQPTGSHGVAFDDPCVVSIMEQFLAAPLREPNGTCLAEIAPAEFIDPDALSFPFIGLVNQLSDALWWQIGLATLFLLGVLSTFVVLPIAWLVGLLRRKEVTIATAVADPKPRRLRWLGGVLALLFGFLAIIFVTGILYFTGQALFNGLAGIFAISGSAAPFFIIPFLLLLIAIVMLIIAFLAWRRGYWSAWARVYYTIVTICAISYVLVLAYGGMLTVLL